MPDQRGEEKAIVRVHVSCSLCVRKSPNGCFRDIGGCKREMKPDVFARLFQQRSQARLIRFDEQVLPGASIASLNPRRWSLFETVLSSKDDQAFLEKMRLIATDGDGAKFYAII
jgi:hypothetical protein